MTSEQAPIWFLAILYFLPAIVASVRKHHNQNAIAVLNIFLGWTLLGWIAALVWASTRVIKDESKATNERRETLYPKLPRGRD